MDKAVPMSDVLNFTLGLWLTLNLSPCNSYNES